MPIKGVWEAVRENVASTGERWKEAKKSVLLRASPERQAAAFTCPAPNQGARSTRNKLSKLLSRYPCSTRDRISAIRLLKGIINRGGTGLVRLLVGPMEFEKLPCRERGVARRASPAVYAEGKTSEADVAALGGLRT